MDSMTEISQLNEMHAVLIAAKENNDRKHLDAQQMMAKITELEKRLEEGVAFTNRYRAINVAATVGLRKRLQAVDDLFLKLDHMARQTSDVYLTRICVNAEGVQEHERVSSQVQVDLTSALERSQASVNRHGECRKQEAHAHTLSADSQSKEKEDKELCDRIKELGGQCNIQDDNAVRADAARSVTLQATKSRKSRRECLEQRLVNACTTLSLNAIQMVDMEAKIDAADRALNDAMAIISSHKQSVSAETEGLELQLAELADCVEIQTRDQLHVFQAELATLVEEDTALLVKLTEVKRQWKQDQPEVAEMKMRLHENTQRRQMLADQLAASQKVLTAHNVNHPEFEIRRAEHNALSVSISALRSEVVVAAARKSELDDVKQRATVETQAATSAAKDKSAALLEEGVRITGARKKAAQCLVPIQMALDKIHGELESLQAHSKEISIRRQNVDRMEEAFSRNTAEHDSFYGKKMGRPEQAVLEQRAEEGRIVYAAEKLEADLVAAKAKAQEEQERRAHAAKEALLTEVMAQKTAEIAAEVETKYVGELKDLQDQIVREDLVLRAACADANHNTRNDGTEERLRIDLNDLRTEEAAIRSEIEAAELRVQRLKESTYFS